MNDKTYISTGSTSLYIQGIIAMAILTFPGNDDSDWNLSSLFSSKKLAFEQIQEQFGGNQHYGRISFSYDTPQSSFNQLVNFAERFIQEQKELDSESRRVLDDFFWELV